MASASSSAGLFGIREGDNLNNNYMKPQQQQSSTPSSSTASPQTAATAAPVKRKRNQPGNPNPDAEVIALSPKTLMATNRFICEVCNKGFQREQNLQLHRRGHNLPWKLKQKSGNKEVRRRVYLCPEPSCVHHDPSRALGDLTGIKKHFFRKHGEKKWKCDKCSKKYAVQSDWRAHSKICGTREYRCDCGTLFSRRDSFITHRAFCDALAQESARVPTNQLTTMASHHNLYGNSNMALTLSQVNSHLTSLQEQTHLSHFDHIISPPPNPQSSSAFFLSGGGGGGSSNQVFSKDSQPQHSLLQDKPFHGLVQLSDLQSNPASFFSHNKNASFMSNASNNGGNNQNMQLMMPYQFNGGNLMGDHLSGDVSSLYNNNTAEPVLPQMSATALLQKAAQMGATTSFRTSFNVENLHANQMQEMMNSIANGSAGLFGGSCTTGEHEQESTRGLGGFDPSMSNMVKGKIQDNFSSASLGVSDQLTRDFLGVGGMVRGMGGGGMSQREQHHGIDHMSSLDAEIKSATSSRVFGGGSL
ncbi:protein indeterminate-domain 4, chloroplastic-like [Typha angustifolia]|uniref:protein indeterminate-domain 4, chloroplastic-like n=1 Tax=Typha angustifolia TaxID=59011 RepID=UPI003C2F4B8C